MIEINPRAKQASPWGRNLSAAEVMAAMEEGKLIGVHRLGESGEYEFYDHLPAARLYDESKLKLNYFSGPSYKLRAHLRSKVAVRTHLVVKTTINPSNHFFKMIAQPSLRKLQEKVEWYRAQGNIVQEYPGSVNWSVIENKDDCLLLY